MDRAFALVDCNNFYASCEKLFRPDLKDRPLVVLSNNDGCVVARSKEAKDLGIKMAVPFFKVKDAIQSHDILTFSSNYSLYADMSSRVMRTLEELAPHVEIYSIDEAFLDVSGIDASLPFWKFGLRVRDVIQQWCGITVCVSIGPTKTLAKLANHGAKKLPNTGGVLDLSDLSRRRALLRRVPVGEVWGVGRRLAKRLHVLGIATAYDLAEAPAKQIRKHFSVVLERTHAELNGESCLELEAIPATKKQIICSRSFGERITEFTPLKEAICEYIDRAGKKIRKEKQAAKVVSVYIRTGAFQRGESQYSNSISGELRIPSDDTRDFIELGVQLLKRIWKPGYRYAKAGVMLSDFYSPNTVQTDLFNPSGAARPNSKDLMRALDKINHNGKAKVFFAGQGMQQSWRMKRENVSPAYTTHWADLPKVK